MSIGTVTFTPRGADSWADPWGEYAALRTHDPVHHVVPPEHPERDYYVLSRHADILAAAVDTQTFSSAQGLTTAYGEIEAIGLAEPPLVMQDPPAHTAFRKLVARGFTPRQVADLEPDVRAFVRERLPALADGGDVVETLFKPLPSMVVAHYLGVPEEDRVAFDGWTEAIVAAVALHPNEAPLLEQAGTLDAALAEIEALAQAHDKIRAVGETGLDHFRTGDEGRAAQEESFRWHVDLAKRLDKTLVIHDRDAHEDVLRVLDSEGTPERWVMHCFSGDALFARACLDRGAHLSFAGTVTFKNADPLREALAMAPQDRILVETDAPYLTPTPYRGRPNASYLVPLTVRTMAQVRGEDLGELCVAIDATTDRAFGGH